MSVLYKLLILGNPSETQITELKQLVSQALEPFCLQLGQEVAWVLSPQKLKLEP